MWFQVNFELKAKFGMSITSERSSFLSAVPCPELVSLPHFAELAVGQVLLARSCDHLPAPKHMDEAQGP